MGGFAQSLHVLLSTNCEVDMVIFTLQWKNAGSETLCNHLQSPETGIQTHILDSESCVHPRRHAAPFGARQMWQILGEKLLEGRRDDSLAGGKGSWPRRVLEARKAYAGDKGVEETTWAEPHWGGGRWMCAPRDQWDSRTENRRAKSRSWQTASSDSLNSTVWTMVSHCRFSERDIITLILWGHHSHNVHQGWRRWRLFKGRKVS